MLNRFIINNQKSLESVIGILMLASVVISKNIGMIPSMILAIASTINLLFLETKEKVSEELQVLTISVCLLMPTARHSGVDFVVYVMYFMLIVLGVSVSIRKVYYEQQ